jgi:hypothetical protein
MKSSFRPRVESLESRNVLSPTSIGLSSSANPSVRGQAVTITATVTGGDFLPGSVPVTYGDQVTFLLDGRQKVFAPVVNGFARITIHPHAGRNFISAVYSGGISLFGNDDPSGTGAVGLVQRCVRHHHRP